MSLKFLRVDAVLNEQTPLGPDTALQTALLKVLGHTKDALVARQAKAVESVVQRRSAGVMDPTVDSGDEAHRPEAAEHKAEEVALVVMPVPDRDLLLAAEVEQPGDDLPVERPLIGNGQERGVPALRFL